MKVSLTLSFLLMAGWADAQPARTIAQSPKLAGRNDHAMSTRLTPKFDASLFSLNLDAPNEIKSRDGKFTYSGVAIQAMKSHEPWQLINPLAPAQYGSGHENFHRDIITGQPVGFRIFSINF